MAREVYSGKRPEPANPVVSAPVDNPPIGRTERSIGPRTMAGDLASFHLGLSEGITFDSIAIETTATNTEVNWSEVASVDQTDARCAKRIVRPRASTISLLPGCQPWALASCRWH